MPRCLLQLVRVLQQGGVEWEQGGDRILNLAAPPPGVNGSAAVRVTCTFGDTSSTQLHPLAGQLLLEVSGVAPDARVWVGGVGA